LIHVSNTASDLYAPSAGNPTTTTHPGKAPPLPAWQVAAIVALGILARGAAIGASPASLQRDPDSYRLYAQSLVDDGTFLRNGLPSAWRVPLYPLLLAGCLSLPGESWWWITALHLLLGGVTVWLTLGIARSWGLGRRALIAGAIVALDPLLVHEATQVMTETLATFMAALSLWAATRWLVRPSTPWGLWCGAALAGSALSRPALLLWALLFMVWALWRFRAVSPLRKLGPVLIGFALLLAPWVARNVLALHRPVLTTTHGGFTLLLANNPQFYQFLKTRKQRQTWDSRPFVQTWQETLREQEIASEIDENCLAYRLAWQNIRQMPAGFVRAALYRQVSLWRLAPLAGQPSSGLSRQIIRLAITLWNFTVFALALFGVLTLQNRKTGVIGGESLLPQRAAVVTPALLLVLALAGVHFVYWTDMRMRAPIVPVLALLAAAGWGWLADRRRAES
jgi:4-amino-4-deoxy-L-arabinose transferase-like glycosyltransferase